MRDTDNDFSQKFGELHQELSNCRNELAQVHLEIGKSRRLGESIPKNILNEEKRLDERITELEQMIKNLKPNSNNDV